MVSQLRKTAACATLAILAVLWLPGPWDARGGDVRLGGLQAAGSRHSYHPALAASGDSACAVWIEENGNGANGVYFSRSRNGGKSWSIPPVLISDPPSVSKLACLAPAVATDGTNVLAAWEVHLDGQMAIHASFSQDSGATWITDHSTHSQVFGTVPLQERSIRVAVSGKRFYILSTLNPYGDNKLTQVILYMSPDAGATWVSRRMDTLDVNNEYDSMHPAISVSGDTVFVAWDDWYNSGNHRQHIRYNVSLDGGATWLGTDDRQLDSGPAPGTYFAVIPDIVAAGTSLYAAWIDSRDGYDSIRFNRSVDGGATWLPVDVRVSTGPEAEQKDSLFPRLAVLGTDVYCAWQVKGDVLTDIETKKIFFNASGDNGVLWGPAAYRLDTDAPAGCALTDRPRITALGNGVIVSWNSALNGNNDLFMQRSSDKGMTWLSAPRRHDSGDAAGRSHSLPPCLVTVSDRALVLWSDTREGRGDIYSRRFPDDTPSLSMSPEKVSPGGTVDFVLTGKPNQAYEIFWSYEGSGYTSYPPYILDLVNPVRMAPVPGPGVFDLLGEAAGSFTVPQPPGVGTHLLRIQGVDVFSSLPSNVFRVTVE